MAAVCCDFIVADILVLDKVEPRREYEHIEEIHDLGIDPFEESGGYRPELLKRDEAIAEGCQGAIIKALDKDCEPEHALSFTRLMALLTIELGQITQKVKLLSKSRSVSMDSRYIQSYTTPLHAQPSIYMWCMYWSISTSLSLFRDLKSLCNPTCHQSIKSIKPKSIHLSNTHTHTTRHKSLTMSFEPELGSSKSSQAKLQSWLNVDGDGRGEEVTKERLSPSHST
jgi:hypothetical protein